MRPPGSAYIQVLTYTLGGSKRAHVAVKKERGPDRMIPWSKT